MGKEMALEAEVESGGDDNVDDEGALARVESEAT